MTSQRLARPAAALLAVLGLGPAEADPFTSVGPVRDIDFYEDGRPRDAKVRLGRLLFFDKILSGNRNIACATCHHPTRGTGDAVALSFGEGAEGLAEARSAVAGAPLLGRVPRNAQPLYFLGAREFTRLYHDGRVEAQALASWDSGFWSPAREQLPRGLDNVLAAQAMFPVLSPIEMAGHKGENEVATAVARDELRAAWDAIAERLRNIDAYVALFTAAFDDVAAAQDVRFVHAANAIAAFEATAFRADGSPFDRYLRTRDRSALTPEAGRGMDLFYGRAGCARCHSGKFQTDHGFHAIAMPQLGPGKNDGFDRSYWRATGFAKRLEDHGRYRETQAPADRYRFRTPSLRNVELTGPWGHSGAFDSLESVVRHHLDPVSSLHAYAPDAHPLPGLERVIERTAVGSRLLHRPLNPGRLADWLAADTWVMRNAALRQSIADANELPPTALNDAEIDDLVAFLRSLTDPRSRDGRALVPESVPSGLPVDD